MSIMSDAPRLVTGGVDTHKDLHVAAAVDHLGAILGTASFPNSAAGHGALLAWMAGFGSLGVVGVEGTGSYGAGLARHLGSVGVEVVEINRPSRSVRYQAGKSDVVDAIEAARAALAGRHAGTPKGGDGIVESIRMLRAVRRSAVRSRTQAGNQILALVDTAPSSVAETLSTLALTKVRARSATLQFDSGDLADPTGACGWAIRALVVRWEGLDEEIGDIDCHLDRLVPAAAPELVELFGVGTHTAAALIAAAGDNPGRLTNEAAFAALCGVSPLPASSGKTNRHRLNRGGNRDANNALWRIAMVRMAHDPRTKAYVERRTQQGLSKAEIIRCLKRYIAREIFHHLPDH